MNELRALEQQLENDGIYRESLIACITQHYRSLPITELEAIAHQVITPKPQNPEVKYPQLELFPVSDYANSH
jgi:hypothetical protein